MNKSFLKSLIYILPALFLALLPYNGKCACAVAGAVCGETPTWNPCCEPDKYECKKSENEDFGTCEEKPSSEEISEE